MLLYCLGGLPHGRPWWAPASDRGLRGEPRLPCASSAPGGAWSATPTGWASALALLVTRVVADDHHATVPADHLSLIHISEPTRRTPISYAVFCLKKKKTPVR